MQSRIIAIRTGVHTYLGFPDGSVVKNLPTCKAGAARDIGLIPGWGTSPGGGNGNPFPCYCLVNPMDRRSWQATVYGIMKSQTQLKRLNTHAHVPICKTCWGHKEGAVKPARRIQPSYRNTG